MSFQADIPGDGIRAFSHSLDALAGFGEELHLEAKKSQLVLWALNMSLTGQAIIRISPRFFQLYRLKRPTAPLTGQKQASLKCRVYLKTLRTVFKKNQNSSRPLDRCEMTMVDDQSDTRLHLKFLCLNGVKKMHSLWFADADPEEQLYPKDSRHSFSVDPAVLNDCLQYFHPRVFDVALECSENVVKIMSYWSEASTLLSSDKPMHTEFSLQSADFVEYNVQGTIRLVFNMKEFKTVLTFAEDTNTTLAARFDGPGKPIVFSVQQAQLMMAEFAVMTHSQDQTLTQISGRSMTPSVLSDNGAASAEPVHTRSQHAESHTHPQAAHPPSQRPTGAVTPQSSRQRKQHPPPPTPKEQRQHHYEGSEDDLPLFFSDEGRISVNHSRESPSRPSASKSHHRQPAAQQNSRILSTSPSLEMVPPEFRRSSSSQDRLAASKNELFAFESLGHPVEDDDSSTDDCREETPVPKKKQRGRFFQN